MKKYLLFLFFSCLSISICVGKTLYSNEFLRVSCSDDVEFDKDDNSRTVYGNCVYIEYKKGVYDTGADAGYSTYLEINNTVFDQDDYSENRIIRENETLSVNVVKCWSSKGNSGWKEKFGCFISAKNTSPKIEHVSYYKINKNQINDLEKKTEGTDTLVKYDHNKWTKLGKDEYILIKTIARDESGIRSLTATNGYSFKGESGTLYTIIGNTDGVVDTKITAVNGVSKETTHTATVKIDNTVPTGICTLNKPSGTWINNILTVETKTEDTLSGIKEKNLVFYDTNGKEVAKYKDADLPQKLLVGVGEKIREDSSSYPKLILPDGEYQIKVSVTDNVGNSSENKYPIKLDFHAPECSIYNTNFSVTGEKISGIRTNFDVRDDISGVNIARCAVKIGSEKEIPLEASQIAKNYYSVEYCFKPGELDRSKANRIEIKVNARDKAGNEIERTSGHVIIPACELPEVDNVSQRPVGENYENKLRIKTGLNKTTSQNITYSYIRDISSPDQEEFIKGNKNSFLKYYDESEYRNYEKFHSKETVKQNVLSDAVTVTDSIPVSYGYGHKMLSYKVYQTYTAWGNEYTEKIGECCTELLNNEPKVELVIEGTENTEIIDVKKIPKEMNIRLPETGIVNMGVRITDYDIENYKVELSRVQTVSFENGKIKSTMVIPEAGCVLSSKTEGSKGISRKSGGATRNFVVPDQEREITTKTGEKIKYNIFPKPVLINFNDYTTFAFTIKEGKETERDTETICFYAAYSHNGLCLEVRNGDYNAKGITAQVNSFVSFNIKMDDNTEADFEWDFGDGKTGKGRTVKNQYRQSEKRTSGESHYQLTVKAIKNGKKLTADAIDVFVMDTQYGEILDKEEWIGEHKVLGKIVVPATKQIKLGTSSKKTTNVPAKIMIYGAQEKGKKGCFEIKGSLISENEEAALFTEMKNTADGFSEIEETENHPGWGGITAEAGAKVALENCEIKYADRGITVKGDGADVKLNRVYLHDNDIGLHVVGGRKVEIKESRIENNRKYGIKEDKNGNESPVVIRDENTTVKENGYTGRSEYPRDHYKAEDGLNVTE